MSYHHYDRLSALDTAFLEIEDGNAHMHIGAIAIFDAVSLTTTEGGIDFERIIDWIGSEIQKNDRFQQKLAYIPAANWPVWVDDARFNLRYHIRHSCLPAPGNDRLLKRLAGRIMSEELDRGKPLWELWFVEGLEGGRFAVISKVHHAMADGVSGADLLSVLMGPDPLRRPEPAKPWRPRPAPSSQQLVLDEAARLARIPFKLLRAGLGVAAHPIHALESVRDEVSGLGSSLSKTLTPASETGFNQELGPHRRFDWARVSIDDIREIRKHLGGTLNDVVLTVLTGAIRRNFAARGMELDDLDFRVMVPVSVRSDDEHDTLGNRVSMLLVPLPIDARDRRERHERVCEATLAAKASHQRAAGEVLAGIADAASSGILTRLVRAGIQNRVANLVVTNIPGPPIPVYLSGAKMLEVYPVVPLSPKQALGVALFSYDGVLYWGFNADWDQLPDLHDFVTLVEHEFADLLTEAAGRMHATAVN